MPGLQTTTASTSVAYHSNSSDLWEYAVPLESDYQQGSDPSSLKSRNYPNSSTNGYNSRHYENKASRSYSNPLEPAGYLDTSTPHSLRHKESTISSNQDGDSLFDLYDGKLSTVGARSTETINGHNGNSTDEESKWIDSEKLARIEGKQLEQLKQSEYNARWIDRDKLERIEIQELEQAGILPPQGSYNALQGQFQSDDRVVTRGRTNSDSSDDERKYYDPNEPDNDPRHPSERATESRGRPMQNMRRNRSSSRIPLYASSPVPVPQHHLERTAPLKRQPPSPDNGSDDDRSTRTHSRKRSYSASSAVLLADSTPPATAVPAIPKPPATPQTSRVKSNVTSPNRSTSKSKGRFTGNNSLAKNKHKSNPQLAPGNRPTSSHHQAPEGPPPWSLSTYTPDPKLPPDQQIIPTVAKRLQQEQWEKEGVFATVYDTKLRPLKVQDQNEQNGQPKEKEAEEPKEKETDEVLDQEVVATSEETEKPLEAPKKPSPPTIATPPLPKEEKKKEETSKVDSPKPTRDSLKPGREENQFAPRTITKINDRDVSQGGQPEAIRMDVPDNMEKKKKKFGCCIVM